MNPPDRNAKFSGGTAQRSNGWSVRTRIAVSLLLLFHLAAVIVAPSATPPPRSELAYEISRWFEPYLSATFLFHGYRFFAPNPGPGHLIRYETIDDQTGEVHNDGVFPNLEQQWPRLLYHRYFMISERIWAESNVPPPPPEGFMNDQQGEDYYNFREQMLQRLEPMLTSVANHLRRRHGGDTVRLFAIEHIIPTPQDVVEGMRLDDPRLYQERLLGDLSSDGTWNWPTENDVPNLYPLP